MRQKAEKYADVYRAVSCVDKPWSERKQSTSGYMTVYLALVMGILLSLILAVLTAVRISTIRMYIECCADMALDSALAEYHREMLDQYDLFFIDTAYQTGDPSYHRTEEHILRYMERNLRPQEEFPTAGAKDLLGLSTEAVELLQAGVATDDGGTVLQYHIVQYMKDYDASFRILEDPLMVVGIGVAFAKEDDRGICEQMDQTLEEMRQDGTSLKIIKNYLDDPQKYLEVDDLGY